MTATEINNKKVSKERGERLHILRIMSGNSFQSLAKLTDYAEDSLRKMENAHFKGGLSEKAARTITKVLEKQGVICQMNWLLYGQGIPPLLLSPDKTLAKQQLEFLRLVDGDLDNDTFIKGEIERFSTFLPNNIVTRVQDDGMEPIYFAGDIVGGIKLYDDQIQRAIGKICITEASSKQILVRKLLQDDQNTNKYKLCCINQNVLGVPSIIANVDLISAALISHVWRTTV